MSTDDMDLEVPAGVVNVVADNRAAETETGGLVHVPSNGSTHNTVSSAERFSYVQEKPSEDTSCDSSREEVEEMESYTMQSPRLSKLKGKRGFAAVLVVAVILVVNAGVAFKVGKQNGRPVDESKISNDAEAASPSLVPAPAQTAVPSRTEAMPASRENPTARPDPMTSTGPTSQPSSRPPVPPTPIPQPTARPTPRPTALPTAMPTPRPTAAPTANPYVRIPVDPRVEPILINAGANEDRTDIDGTTWKADHLFSANGTQYVLDSCPRVNATVLEDVFCYGRKGVQRYNIPVRNGIYAVTLHLLADETERTYDIAAEGVLVYREVHQQRDPIFEVKFVVEVKDSLLSIVFLSDEDDDEVPGAVVVAVEVRQALWAPNEPTTNVSFIPGLLTVEENGLLLSEGLQSRIIGNSGEPVEYHDGNESATLFHPMPDAGETFLDKNRKNPGGWIYVSNSEAESDRRSNAGGVGAFTFDKHGNIIDYQMVLTGTTNNCGGGKTPWGTWVSGEELAYTGKIWQVDPFGNRHAERITMGEQYPGMFESFAYDVRNIDLPRFFMTQDQSNGALRRFTPWNPDWSYDPWTMLTGNGTLEFLELLPDDDDGHYGSYQWVSDHSIAADSAKLYYPYTEGIHANDNKLYFVCKELLRMFVLNLDDFTYTSLSTDRDLFGGEPDQIKRLFSRHPSAALETSWMYLTEDGGGRAGIHAVNEQGQGFTILESPIYTAETTGLAFSPNGKHLYVAFQHVGRLFDITRLDGLPFHAQTLNVKYHAMNLDKL